jgi:branched-subunit amino acid ABC-type transport system permease component
VVLVRCPARSPVVCWSALSNPLLDDTCLQGIGPVAPYVLMLLVLILRPGGLFAQISQKKV